VRLVLGQQQGQEQLAAVDHAPEVDADQPGEVVERLVGEVARHGDARVVHEHVHVAVLGHDLGGQALHARAFGDVGDVQRDLAAQRAHAGRGLLEPGLVHVDERERAAALGQRQRQRPADPLAAPVTTATLPASRFMRGSIPCAAGRLIGPSAPAYHRARFTGSNGDPCMNFDFSEDQKLLQKTARDFLAERSPLQVDRDVLEKGTHWNAELWKAAAEMGWQGAAIPEEYGGAGFGTSSWR